MSMTLKSLRARLANSKRVSAGVAAILVVLAGLVVWQGRLFHRVGLGSLRTQSKAEVADVARPEPQKPSDPGMMVTLPLGKVETAHLKCSPATYAQIPTEIGVLGQIQANANRRVDVRSRVVGVIREVTAQIGQDVKRGDPLVTIDSPDVGTARLNVRARQRELLTARSEANWRSMIAANVEKIIPKLLERTHTKTHEDSEIKKHGEDHDAFLGRYPLGTFRGTLLSALADLEIAAHEEVKVSELTGQKIYGEHPLFLAQQTHEKALAQFEGILEQARFDARQQRLIADTQMKLAESAVVDAAQRLRLLGVVEDIPALLDHPESAADPRADLNDVTLYAITAPFDGRVISKTNMAVASHRVETTDVLFVLADLSKVWVSAQVHEADLGALNKLRNGNIELTCEAYPGRTFAARILSIGSEVDPNNRSVSVLAETPNPDGLLILGMFARIVLDTAQNVSALVVPKGAVVEIDGKTGVFVPVPGTDGEESKTAGESTYRFQPIKTGREVAAGVTVLSGLKAGDQVVAVGAFTLKSELVLQNTPEEE